MFKVLHVVGSLGIGGTELLLMQYLRYPKLENYFIVFTEFNHKNNLSEYVDKSRVLTIDKIRLSNVIQNYVLINSFIRDNKINVLHTHVKWSSGMFVLYAWLMGIKRRIVHAHSANRKKGFFQFIYQRLMRLLILFFGTHLVANSSSSGRTVFGKSKYIYLPNYIEADPWLSSVKQRKPYELVFVGRLSEVKNLGFMLRVLAELPSEFKLTVVGDGPEKNHLLEMTRNLGLEKRVVFQGFRSDIKSFLLAAKIFVSPSISEGLGISLIEAQLTGTLCVVSDGYPLEAVFLEENVKRLSLNIDLWKEIIVKVNNSENMLSTDEIMLKYDMAGFSRANQIKMIYKLYG